MPATSSMADAAVHAGLSRNTAHRIEKGGTGLAFGRVLRYLEAIAPDAMLASLLAETDPTLGASPSREAAKRVKGYPLPSLGLNWCSGCSWSNGKSRFRVRPIAIDRMRLFMAAS